MEKRVDIGKHNCVRCGQPHSAQVVITKCQCWDCKTDVRLTGYFDIDSIEDCPVCKEKGKKSPMHIKGYQLHCEKCDRDFYEDNSFWSECKIEVNGETKRFTTEFCYKSGCEYFYGEIGECMLGEDGVPDNLEQKCRTCFK